MKRFFAYFGFNKAERRGFSALVLLTFLIGMVPMVYRLFVKVPIVEHSVTYFSDIEEEQREALPDTKNIRTSPTIARKESLADISYVDFDPNGLPESEWKRMGFSSRQITVIKNYEAKGGKFYKKEDVAKIYSISDEDYERIAPYIVIQRPKDMWDWKSGADHRQADHRPKVSVQPMDINTADTTIFKTLKGIGSVLSTRIVKYREALGGFHTVAQIGEVYGISPEVFEAIRPWLLLENVEIKKLNGNTSTKEELARHPYVSNKEASLIVNYRTQHDRFSSLEDLRKILVLDEDFFRKIEPYIEF